MAGEFEVQDAASGSTGFLALFSLTAWIAAAMLASRVTSSSAFFWTAFLRCGAIGENDVTSVRLEYLRAEDRCRVCRG